MYTLRTEYYNSLRSPCHNINNMHVCFWSHPRARLLKAAFGLALRTIAAVTLDIVHGRACDSLDSEQCRATTLLLSTCTAYSFLPRHESHREALVRALRKSLNIKKSDSNGNASGSASELVIDPEQAAWEAFSKWLQTHKLKEMTLPVDLPVCTYVCFASDRPFATLDSGAAACRIGWFQPTHCPCGDVESLRSLLYCLCTSRSLRHHSTRLSSRAVCILYYRPA